MRFLALLAVLAFLSGCGSPDKTTSYTPPANPGGRLCTNQCSQARQFCSESCDLTRKSCIGKTQSQALTDYNKYAREQNSRHEAVEFNLSDFERFDSCNKTHESCYDACDKTYGSCYQNCGGKVSTTSSCQFLCF
jgi:hypothetical protein